MEGFTQDDLARLFSTTKQNVSLALTGEDFNLEQRIVGRNRKIRRLTKTYGNDALYKIAVRCRRLDTYRSICKQFGIEPSTVVDRRKEIEFSDLLSVFLEGKYKVIPQYRLGSYVLDFYIEGSNLAVEFDEDHHSRPRHIAKDAERQGSLEADFGLRVVRVRQGREMSGLFEIAEALLSASLTTRTCKESLQVERS